MVVILPGLDGTGRLLDDFSAALAARYDVAVLRYPTRDPLSYDDLLAYVRARLPQREFLLVGESFSGPLALRLAAEEPPGLRAVVLGASFARLDLSLKRALAAAAAWVPPRLVPFALLNALLMGGRASPEQRRRLAGALREVSPQVLAGRVRAALQVDLMRAGITIRLPLLYLRASADRLVSRRAVEPIVDLAPHLSVIEVPAPHFLFQMEPALCAQAISAFDLSLARKGHAE